MVKAKLNKTVHANLFISAVLQTKRELPQRKKNRLFTTHKATERSTLGITLREHILNEVMWEGCEGCDRGVSKVRGAYDKFPDFFLMGTFIDTTHMKL